MKREEQVQKLLIPEKKLREAMELYSGKTWEEVRQRLYHELGKRMLAGCLAAAAILLLAGFSGKNVTVKPGVQRPGSGEAPVSMQIQVELEDRWKNISLEIGSLEYEESRIEELHEEAVRYLAETVPGENKSFILQLCRVVEAKFIGQRMLRG